MICASAGTDFISFSLRDVNNSGYHAIYVRQSSTAGIMGLFPAVVNLPVRLTQTEDAGVGAVKNARGTLIGWTLPPLEAARVGNLTQEEIVLEQRPIQLLIKLKAPTGTLESPYGDGVYCLKPRIRVWSRDNAGYAKARGKWKPWYWLSIEV